jgi:hypothetical protein
MKEDMADHDSYCSSVSSSSTREELKSRNDIIGHCFRVSVRMHASHDLRPQNMFWTSLLPLMDVLNVKLVSENLLLMVVISRDYGALMNTMELLLELGGSGVCVVVVDVGGVKSKTNLQVIGVSQFGSQTLNPSNQYSVFTNTDLFTNLARLTNGDC